MWLQTAKQDGDRISKQFLCSIWKKRNERPNVGGVSIRSRNGAPSRKGCVVNGQMTKTSDKRVRPPPARPRLPSSGRLDMPTVDGTAAAFACRSATLHLSVSCRFRVWA